MPIINWLHIKNIVLIKINQARAVKAMMVKDSLFNLLDDNSSQKKLPVANDLPVFDDLNPADLQSELTSAEIESLKVQLNLLKTTLSISNGSSKKKTPPSPEINDFIAEITEWLTNKSASLTSQISASYETMPISRRQSSVSSAPTWIYFHSNITLLETLKAIKLFTIFVTKAKSLQASSQLQNLEPLIQQIIEKIKSKTQELKAQIATSGILGDLVSLVMGNHDDEPDSSEDTEQSNDNKHAPARFVNISAVAEELMDVASLELFFGSLMDSWDEALDGVLALCASLGSS